jgi:hypothetical protein
MSPFKQNILNCLKDLKGSGKFITAHTTEFQFPELETKGVGEIAYPINQNQAKALIDVAHKAPFGKGSKTIVDKSVRSAWEIDASELVFKGSRWNSFLDKILKNIKPQLGLENHNISAHLYKMLIYEKGDFFLPHKDSEKEKGMFGTLVIGLPSKHTGGELVVRFEGKEEVVDFSAASGDYKISYAAFYADCDHEIKPLTSGYRICLVYNLVQQTSEKKIQLTSVETYSEQLAEILLKGQQEDNIEPHIILLGHQYTPENFSAYSLKLNDRLKAETLLRAADKAGAYAKMCLVTSYQTGAAEYDSEDDEEMGEVDDDSLTIEHWLESDLPGLTNIIFEENDLIASFELNEGDPIIKESTGYMGNYGPDVMHWYHYGAVVIWSKEINAELLPQQNTKNTLDWINYFNKNLKRVSKSEITAVDLLLSAGLKNATRGENANFNAIADWAINRKDEAFFLKQNLKSCQSYFVKIDAVYWLKLANYFPTATTAKILQLVTTDINLEVIEQMLAVLRVFYTTDKLNQLVLQQIKNLPHYFSGLSKKSSQKEPPATRFVLDDLFWLENKVPQDESWVNQIAEIIAGYHEQKYFNHLLVPQLLALTEKTRLTNKIIFICRQHLQERVDNKPQPPSNWRREMPLTTTHKKEWQLLKSFLESPDQEVFDYRKNQNERNDLENALRSVVIDVKTETIKRGSPHTLRITKTQAAYNNQMKRWNEERALLNNIMKK